uniref:Cnidarian restricted protein n=1 Tax=Clytia hemisphaerica TaxID=252671 RepID=A0A7M5V4V7_9CNID
MFFKLYCAVLLVVLASVEANPDNIDGEKELIQDEMNKMNANKRVRRSFKISDWAACSAGTTIHEVQKCAKAGRLSKLVFVCRFGNVNVTCKRSGTELLCPVHNWFGSFCCDAKCDL